MGDEIPKTPEVMKTVNHILIFDVDGVITNPSEKRVTEPEILDHIANKLKIEPVAFNTGRSLTWLIERVINPLLERVGDKKVLDNFIAVGEKGGTWLTFDENGKMQHHKDNSISVPQSLQNKIRDLISSEFSESMFFDESKETMISTEMKDGYAIEEYREHQNILNKKLEELVENESLNEQLKVDPTTIAIDIENKRVGKGFAVKQIIKWLKNKEINPKIYIAFGDSFSSDISMAEEIHSQGLPVEFVYVGKENVQMSGFPFPAKRPTAHFENGTLEFLKTL